MPATTPLTILTDRDVARAAPPLSEIVELVRDIYRMQRAGPEPGIVHGVVHYPEAENFTLTLAAGIPALQASGVKIVSYYPGNTERDLPHSSGVLLLNDWQTGFPTVLMEAMWFTYVRTAAIVAAAASYLSKPAPARLGLVGAGGLTSWSLRALSTVFPTISEVRVASRHPESRTRFCAQMAAEGSWDIRPVDDVREAVSGCDLVVSSTTPGEAGPLRGAWCTPGTLIIALAGLREWDSDTLRDADRLVANGTRDDLLRYPAGHDRDFVLSRPWEFLTDVASQPAGAGGADTARIFTAIQGDPLVDIGVAAAIYDRAKRDGLGTVLALTEGVQHANS